MESPLWNTKWDTTMFGYIIMGYKEESPLWNTMRDITIVPAYNETTNSFIQCELSVNTMARI